MLSVLPDEAAPRSLSLGREREQAVGQLRLHSIGATTAPALPPHVQFSRPTKEDSACPKGAATTGSDKALTNTGVRAPGTHGSHEWHVSEGPMHKDPRRHGSACPLMWGDGHNTWRQNEA